MLGNYLQQTTSAYNIFRCIFFLGALRVIKISREVTVAFSSLSVYITMVKLLTFGRIHFRNSGRAQAGPSEKLGRSDSKIGRDIALNYGNLCQFKRKLTGPRSAVGNVSGYRCVSDCRSRGREFDPGPVPYLRGD